MKHTWEEFQRYIQDKDIADQFSPHDLALAERDADAGFGLAEAKLGFAAAKSGSERARYNAAAERIRRESGGYLGGADGSGFLPAGAAAARERAGETYRRQRDALLQEAEQPFSYDPEADPVWQRYVKQYERAGQRAGADALGAAAAATGGVPSSYAVTAAAQAEGAYAAQLSQQLPTFFRDAYDRYSDAYRRKLELAEEYEQAAQREEAAWEADQNRRELDYRAWLGQFLEEW